MLTALLALASLIPGAPGPAPEPARLTILVPAYFYPAGKGLSDWDRLIASADKAPIVAIVNPASGPGPKADPNYVALLDRAAKKRGLTLVGYATTSYGKRPVAEVEADLARWLKLYPQIRGFFLDEQASGPEALDHYVTVYRAARRLMPKGLIISNPGTNCVEGYLTRPTTDVACLYEGHDDFTKVSTPGWARSLPPSRFAALPYKVATPDAMRQAIRHALSRRFGYLYVTDASGANPWDRLPSYWDAEVETIAAFNRADR